MLTFGAGTRVFVALEAFDMRGSFDALAGAVRRHGHEPLRGDVFLFLNVRRTLAKALWFDGSGWCVLAKRLERGSFQLPRVSPRTSQVVIDAASFAALLAGLDYTVTRDRWHRVPVGEFARDRR